MARVAGVDLPRGKRIDVALTYIFGIGRRSAMKIVTSVGFDPSLRSDKLTEQDIAALRAEIDKSHKVEGDLRREIGLNIKRLVDLGTYRGLRHKKGLPTRGQRTHSNARTRKGPRKTVAGKKSVKQLK